MRLATTALLLICLVATPPYAGSDESPPPSDWEVEELPVEGQASPRFNSTISEIETHLFEGTVESIFASLDESIWIEVDYESKGCFDAQDRRIEIRGGPEPDATVSTPGLFPDDPMSGVIALSRADLDGLDRLVGFYRTIGEGSCTTRERVVLRWRTGRFFPRTIRTEEYVDETCGTTFLDNILTFRELLNRLAEKDAA